MASPTDSSARRQSAVNNFSCQNINHRQIMEYPDAWAGFAAMQHSCGAGWKNPAFFS
jgi:hypothetical protein